MDGQERNNHGRYKDKVTLDEVLTQFDGTEPRTATEIAEKLDVTNRTALNKLDELRKRGEINRKEVGARAVVWWRSD